jgi:hypothetical protein
VLCGVQVVLRVGTPASQPSALLPETGRTYTNTEKVAGKIPNFNKTNGQTDGKFLLVCSAVHGKTVYNFRIQIRPFKNA